MQVLSATFDMQSKRIVNVTDPSGVQDAATKNYVDNRVPLMASANTWFGNDLGVSSVPVLQPLAALTKVDDTNVTVALGGTPATALSKAVSITLGWTGTLALARGGLGVNAASAAAHTFFGNSTTGAAAPSFQQPDFTDLSGFATTAQAGLPTGGTVGQILKKNSSTNYDAVWDAPDSAQVVAAANPPGVLGATQKMSGYGTATYGPFLFTPAFTGKVLINLAFGVANDIANATCVVVLRRGTGTAPLNQAAVSGTTGPSYVRSGTWAAGAVGQASLMWVITGLTPGTQYWFDLSIASGAAGQTCSVSGGQFTAAELP